MTCQEFVELITDYLDGALTTGEFETHLASCPGCTQYLRQFEHTIQTLRQRHQATRPWIGPTMRDAAIFGGVIEDWHPSVPGLLRAGGA